MMATATGIEQIVDRYIAAWNETDPASRRDLIAQIWTEDGRYLDPLMSGDGHDGIDAMIAGVQAQFPGYRFRRTGGLDAHHDVVRFSWQLGPGDGPALAGGVDFGVLRDGRLQTITGFLDFAPGGERAVIGRVPSHTERPSSPALLPVRRESGRERLG